MKTREEIEKKLNEILEDERLSYPPADTETNAPLALIQVALENQRDILKWVLRD